MSAPGADGGSDAATGCDIDGVHYDEGDLIVPASQYCDNACYCVLGENKCNAGGCGTICVYAGIKHTGGDSFPARDGCNTCSCEDGGSITCTEKACACDPQAQWWRDYVSTDPGQCMVIDYACPPYTTAFGNSCGCGCEEDESCPQVFDCMPPAPPECDGASVRCPYSSVGL